MIQRGDELVTSSLTLGEVLVAPIEAGNTDLAKRYEDFIDPGVIGITGLGPRAFRGRNVEQLLEQGVEVRQAVAALGEGEEVNSDLYAGGDYRRHLARVHAVRAVNTAIKRAS